MLFRKKESTLTLIKYSLYILDPQWLYTGQTEQDTIWQIDAQYLAMAEH